MALSSKADQLTGTLQYRLAPRFIPQSLAFIAS
jgi:hypothetical protein